MKRRVHGLVVSLAAHGLLAAGVCFAIVLAPRTSSVTINLDELSLSFAPPPAEETPPAPVTQAAPKSNLQRPAPVAPKPPPEKNHAAAPMPKFHEARPTAPPVTASPLPSTPPAVTIVPAPTPAPIPAASITTPAATPAAAMTAVQVDDAGATDRVGENNGEDDLSDAERARIADHLGRYVFYPYRARQQGWQGRVLVAVRLKADGGLGDVKVVTGSGCALLDESAVKAVRKAAPFPALGREIRGNIPVNYRLR